MIVQAVDFKFDAHQSWTPSWNNMNFKLLELGRSLAKIQ